MESKINTLMVSIGLARFIPPSGNIIAHIMPIDDDEISEPVVNGSITRRRMNATRILKAVNDGYDLVWMISKEAKVGEQTTREILNDLAAQGMIKKTARYKRGSPNRYLPV
jgi:hypothetical protein